ncbi:MAG: 1-acyl-sn-glycerol-3-phosphate acyltransferase [Alloprevotella sp.]|nr:1-acyl-sn-glycerol-3-phosphate acyltransferase [Alloprevotella sp.]
MYQKICRLILFRWLGWTYDLSLPERPKCILCVAPHTSNWDFVLGEVFYGAIGRKSGFMMKKNWFFWPLGVLLRRIGGIPVERKKHTSLTDAVAEIARNSDTFHLAITPEGTRKKVDTWKRGFYVIALKASIPIQLYALDYAHKKIVCTREIIPDEALMEQHMREIMDYYKPFCGRHPEKFQVESF